MSVVDVWQGKRTGPGLRYLVRYRDETGRGRKERFAMRPEADLFDAQMKLDPAARRKEEARTLTVEQMMQTWIATKADREPSTRRAYAQDVADVVKAFGHRLASSLVLSEITIWSARATPGPSKRRRAMVALRAAYGLAMADRLLTEDPTKGAKLPAVRKTNQRYLTWVELERLADAAGDYKALVWILGTCGLRLEEAAALDATDIDRQRSRLRILKSKTHVSRDVPVMDFIMSMLPKNTIGPLFLSPRGSRLSGHNFRERQFADAAQTAGIGRIKPHELRHTAASLAIASGADLKYVQNMLGHKDATMTLNLYGHLLPDELNSVATRMDEARRKALRPVSAA